LPNLSNVSNFLIIETILRFRNYFICDWNNCKDNVCTKKIDLERVARFVDRKKILEKNYRIVETALKFDLSTTRNSRSTFQTYRNIVT